MTKPTSGAFDDYPPGQANKFTVTLAVEMVGDQNGDGKPNYGDTIQFAVTNSGESAWNQISVTGKQNGAVICSAVVLAANPLPVTLTSRQWEANGGGAADFRAEALWGSDVLGYLDFHVAA
jgi:hypothetical protein